MTVLELVERYLAIKDLSVKKTTKAGHQTVLNVLKKENFAQMEISKVKVSDAKLFLIKLQQEDGKSYGTIHIIRGVLRPAFQMALEDDLILRNPFEFQVSLVLVNDSVTREAITLDQMRKFLNFVKEDKHFSRYYEAFYILFHTGMRISEFCGLTVKDLNMKEGKIGRALIVSTGAMLSTISPFQGESIPGIAHAISLESVSGIMDRQKGCRK